MPRKAKLKPQDLSDDAFARVLEKDKEGRPLLGGIPLLRLIGRGAVGSVYYGLHPRLEVEVAVKVLPTSRLGDDPDTLRRFLKEARLTASLSSEHIVRVYDVDEQLDTHYIVMEYVHGRNAQDHLVRRVRLPEKEALTILTAATKGLAEAHKAGIIHRDMKPGNILIPEGEPEAAKITDLGLGKSMDGTMGTTKTNMMLGTEGFLPPEQILEAKKAGPRADVYSMGATCYAFLTGHPPIEGSSAMGVLIDTVHKKPRPLSSKVSKPIRTLLEKCLEKDPEKRFSDASDLLRALQFISNP